MMTIRKFRWSTDGGASWTYEESALPCLLAGTGPGDALLLEAIGPTVSLPPQPQPLSLLGLWAFTARPDGAAGSLVPEDGSGAGITLAPLSGTTLISGGRAVFAENALALQDSPQPLPEEDRFALPPGANGPAAGGFTCTGLDLVTAGRWAGHLVIGNDGRRTQEDPGTQSPSLVLVPRDRPGEKAAEFSVPASGSLQGVAFDSRSATIWYADQGGHLLRRVDQQGLELQQITTGTLAPNGLAYVPGAGQLIVAPANNAERYVYDSETGSLLGQFRGASSLCDQLAYDARSGRLYESFGANGTDARIAYLDLALTGGVAGGVAGPKPGGGTGILGPFAGVQAVEGIWPDRDRDQLWIASDGAFHGAEAVPAENQLIRLSLNGAAALPGRTGSGRAFTFGLRGDLGPAPEGLSEQIFGEADGAAGTISFGLYHIAGTGGIRLKSRARNGVVFQADFPALPAGEHGWVITVDLDAGICEMLLDGSPLAPALLTGSDWSGQFNFTRLVLGREAGGTDSRFLTAEISAFAFASGADAAEIAAIVAFIG